MSDDLYSVYGGGDDDSSDYSSSLVSSPFQSKAPASSSLSTSTSPSPLASSPFISSSVINSRSPSMSSSFEEITLEFWENQRFRALQGWSPSFPGSNVRNFTNLSSTRALEGLDNAGTRGSPPLSLLVHELFPAPQGWEWIDDVWSIDLKGTYGTVDPEGWSYASSLDLLIRQSLDRQLRGEKTSMSMARRRRWIRTLRIIKSSELFPDSASTSAALITRENLRRSALQSVLKRVEANQALYQSFNKTFSTLPLRITKGIQDALTSVDVFYLDLINSMDFLLSKLRLLQTFLSDHIALERAGLLRLVEVTHKWGEMSNDAPKTVVSTTSYNIFSSTKNNFLSRIKTSLQEKMTSSALAALSLDEARSKVGVFKVLTEAQRKIIGNKEKYLKKLEDSYLDNLVDIISQLEEIVDRCNEEGAKIRDAIVGGIEQKQASNQLLLSSFSAFGARLSKLKSEVLLTSSTSFVLHSLESESLPFLSPDLTDFSFTTTNLYSQFSVVSPSAPLPTHPAMLPPYLPPAAQPAPPGALNLNFLENDLWFKSLHYGQRLITLGSVLINYETEAKIMKKKVLEISTSSTFLIRKIVRLMVSEHVKVGEELIELLGISDELGFNHEGLLGAPTASASASGPTAELAASEESSVPAEPITQLPPFSPSSGGAEVDYDDIYDSSSRFKESGLSHSDEFQIVSPINKSAKPFFSASPSLSPSTSEQAFSMTDSPLLRSRTSSSAKKPFSEQGSASASSASDDYADIYGSDDKDEVSYSSSITSTPTPSTPLPATPVPAVTSQSVAPKRTSIFGNLFGSSPTPATPPPVAPAPVTTPFETPVPMTDSPLLKKASIASATSPLNVALSDSFNDMNPLKAKGSSVASAPAPAPVPAASRSMMDSPIMKVSGKPNALLTRTRSSVVMTPSSASSIAASASISASPTPGIASAIPSITPRRVVSSAPQSVQKAFSSATRPEPEKSLDGFVDSYVETYGDDSNEEEEEEKKANGENVVSFLDIQDNFSTSFLPQFTPLFSHIVRCAQVSFSLLGDEKIFDDSLVVLTYDGFIHFLLTPNSSEFNNRVHEKASEIEDGGVSLLSFVMEHFLDQVNCPLSLPISRAVVQSVISIEKYEDSEAEETETEDEDADKKDDDAALLSFVLPSQSFVFPHTQPGFDSSLTSYPFPTKWVKGVQINFDSSTEARVWKSLLANPFLDPSLPSYE